MCVSDYIIKTEIVLKKKKKEEMNEKVDIRVHFGNLADLSVCHRYCGRKRETQTVK